jgi:hypothetical protein
MIGSLILGFFVFLLTKPFCYDESVRKNSPQKSNLHTVQTIIESFAVNHKGYYPKNFQILKKKLEMYRKCLESKKGIWNQPKKKSNGTYR